MGPIRKSLGLFVLFFLPQVCLAQAGGPIQRLPNTTLQMPTNPPTLGYTWSNALGTLTFTNPVALASPPGETNRLFIVEKKGRIVVITNLAAPTRTVFMDISSRVLSSTDTTVSGEEGCLGLAFHPGYATNGYFYVSYTGNATTSAGTGRHDILSRFSVSGANPNQGDAASEVRFILQYDEASNHNAGDLHFGADGYLYVSLGDEGGAYDNWANSQRIDKDFFSAIMRLDVGPESFRGSLTPHAHAALPALTNYAIPPDNPYVGATTFNGLPVNSNNVRTEFWAVGMRNPWRFSFDPVTGLLYLGHVGQGTYEWVNIVSKGTNPGWNYYEGTKQWTNSAQIPTNLVWTPPLVQYGHSGGRNCIIGGVVSRGYRLSQLYGAYLYADYGSGEIWALRHTGTNVSQNSTILTNSGAAFSAFGVDPSNGDVLYAALKGGINSTINRLIYNTITNGAPLPPTLASTGAFTNVAALGAAPGVVPYDLNVPSWSDNAYETRWFSVPNTNLTITFSREGNWSFPTGTVWIQHFELELTKGVPASRKRLETRFLVKNAAGAYGVTYRWGASTTDAALVPEEGMDESFVINDGGGVMRTQVWRYPSRIECSLCHTATAGYALGFNTPQLNRDFNYGGSVTNQLAALGLAGYFSASPTGLHTLRTLAHPTNAAVSLEYRTRSYVAANCAQCHQPGGSAPTLWDGRITTTTAASGIVNGALVNNGGDTNNRVVKPGSLANSMMLARISTPGVGRMPPLDSNLLDTNAIALLSAWISNDLPSFQTFADWQIAHFGSTNALNAAATGDPDGDGARNYLEYLTGTDPLLPASYWKIGIQRSDNLARVTFSQIANRGFEVQSTTNLFSASSWSPVDVTGNEPFFSISNRSASVSDLISNSTSKFYRLRVFEP
jgi:glucose/arabinose dehydrogenase/mono/diheme cytochrome c family protein